MARPTGSFGKAPKSPIATRRGRKSAESTAVQPESAVDDGASYAAVRTSTERTRGRLLELELQVRRGDLLARTDVERDNFARARMVRNRILGIGPRIAAEVHAAGSIADCQRILDRELRLALEALADEVRNER